MTTRILAAAAAAVLLAAATAPAQTPGVARGTARGTAPFTRPRPAVRAPEPPRAGWRTPPHGGPGADLFRARPWTYRPTHLFFPGSFGFASPVYAPWPSWPAAIESPAPPQDAASVYVRPEVPPARPQPYEPGSPGPAKTLYVIRGCYAGDVPPRADALPNGCDAAAVRVIRPHQR